MSVLFEPRIQDLDQGNEISPANLASIRQLAKDRTFLRDVADVKIWLPDGRIAYALDESLIGRSLQSPELTAALKEDRAVSYFEIQRSDPADSDQEDELNEIFVPLHSQRTGEVIAIGEFSSSSTRLMANVREVLAESSLATLGIGLLAAISLSLIAVQGSRTLARQLTTMKDLEDKRDCLQTANTDLELKVSEVTARLQTLDKEVQRRIGIELHDGPAQLLAYVMMQIDQLISEDQSELAPGEARQLAVNIRQAAGAAINDLREISRGLFLGRIDAASTHADAMKVVLLAHELRTGKPVEVEGLEILAKAPENIRAVAAQVVREALANGHKHAQAVGLAVRVVREDTGIRVVVSDLGPGISETSLERPGIGIAGMQYRMHSVGGSVEVKVRPGAGTDVILSFPLAT
jgi:signal transduction histidine kinase